MKIFLLTYLIATFLATSLFAQVFDETKDILERSIPLKWEGGDPDGDPVLYDVYFGTDSLNIPMIASDNPDSFYVVNVEYNTKYFWKVNSKDYSSVTLGQVWWFETERQP